MSTVGESCKERKREGITIVDFDSLMRMDEDTLEDLSSAFVGPLAFGVVGIRGVPGYAGARKRAFSLGADLAVHDKKARQECAGVRQTYPGWNGVPGHEAHPLQSNFLHNIKEDVGNCAVDTFFGKNQWPNAELKESFVALNEAMYPTAVQVMKGCDMLVEKHMGALPEGRMSMCDIAEKGTTLAGRFIWYDSAFSRDDSLHKSRPESSPISQIDSANTTRDEESDDLASMRTHATCIRSTGDTMHGTVVEKESDDLASMRTHATAIRTSGDVRVVTTGKDDGDELASMRTHATAIRSSGDVRVVTTGKDVGDELASMRTHATAIRSSGDVRVVTTGKDDGDELASMRTHATAIRSSGEVGGIVDSKQASDTSVGDYWLPWHIDSQFITLLTCDEFFNEATSSGVEPPADRANVGLQVMNEKGDVVAVPPQLTEDIMMVQMGGFAQIFSGGVLTAGRHAVLRRSASPGIARATYCNFWYAPWDLICSLPPGGEPTKAINSGWNALMDDSYVDISMMLSFYRFREFFTQTPVSIERHPHASSFCDLTKLLPSTELLPCFSKSNFDEGKAIVIDVLTDIRCPFSHIALRHLQCALRSQHLENHSVIRYHPVFLNPNIPEEGEDLDIYLQREHHIGVEEFYSPQYPLMLAARKVDVQFNKGRRVVNTINSFAAVKLVADTCVHLGNKMFQAVSTAYFKEGVDISCLDSLCEIALRVGAVVSTSQIREQIPHIMSAYTSLSSFISSVPCFIIRRGDATGAGIKLSGVKSIDVFEKTLTSLVAPMATASHTHPTGVDLLSPPGMLIPVSDGMMVMVKHADPRSPVSLHSRSRHGFYPSAWPYTPSDFSRRDESSDELKYAAPRLVTHMDDSALTALTELYRCIFQTLVARSSAESRIALLDTCGSWNTFYPVDALSTDYNIVVQGLNELELAENVLATQTIVQDLNKDSSLPFGANSFDFISNVASIEYMKSPCDHLSECHRLLRPGGVLVIAFSNRCFDDKAINIWLRRIAVGAGLVDLVSNWLHFAVAGGEPWAHMSTLDLSPAAVGGKASDPLYAVVAVK